MNPPDIKLIGDLTEQQFLSLMIRDEKDKNPGLSGRIHHISEKAKEEINYDYLMSNNLKTRNLLLLSYFIQHIPRERPKDLQDSFERVYSAFSKCFRGNKQPIDAQIDGLLKVARQELGLVLHEDDFELVEDSQIEKVEKEAKREGSPTKSPPSPVPQTYSPLSFSNLYTTAIAATTTLVNKKFGTRDPETQAEFDKNKDQILKEFISPIDHLLSPSIFLDSQDVKSIFRLFKNLYNTRKDKPVFDVVEKCLDTPSIMARSPADAVKERLQDYKNSNIEHPARFMFIPYPYSAHIVIIAVDFIKKTVMYYDSQGLNSLQRREYADFDMNKELNVIKSHCFPSDPEAKIVEGTSVHQEGDKHNCGVYIAHFAENLLEGVSFEENQKQAIPYKTIETFRLNYAKQLIRFSEKYLNPEKVNIVLKRLEKYYNSFSTERSVDTNETIRPEILIKTVSDHLASYKGKKSPHYLFIPVNENNHLVMVAIDFRTKVVMFFDPKGRKPSSQLDLKSVSNICFGSPSQEVLKNEYDQQEWRSECGTYILNFAEQIMNGVPFGDIVANPLENNYTNPQFSAVVDARIKYMKMSAPPKF